MCGHSRSLGGQKRSKWSRERANGQENIKPQKRTKDGADQKDLPKYKGQFESNSDHIITSSLQSSVTEWHCHADSHLQGLICPIWLHHQLDIYTFRLISIYFHYLGLAFSFFS